MLSSLNVNIKNYKFSKYLSDCDLINKYNFKNINEKPKLSKILLEFSSQDILSACDVSNKKEWDSELQIKAFLLMYLLQSNIAFINFNKNSNNRDEFNFALKSIIISAEELHNFLITMFIENINMLFIESFSLLKSSLTKYNKYLENNQKFVLNTKVSGSTFFELDIFLNKNSYGLNPNRLNMKIGFLFKKGIDKKKEISLNLIKNLPFFWVVKN
jgi:hypothetical protein